MKQIENDIHLHELKQIIKICNEGHVVKAMISELEELIDYAKYVPYKNYSWDVSCILSRYYADEVAEMDSTYKEIMSYICSERVTARSKDAWNFKVR